MQPDYSDNAVVHAIAKITGFPVDDETKVFRVRDATDFAYWDYEKDKVIYIKLKHYYSADLRFDAWMGFAQAINTIAVYVPTEAAS